MPTITTFRPGDWVHEAQAALDELGRMASVDEVVATFETARSVTERILGFPVGGGHASGRAVRAVDVLLHHRLAPALVAEALTFAAVVADHVETTTIETLLETAVHAELTWRPVRIADHHPLLDQLSIAHSEDERQRIVLDSWAEHRCPGQGPDRRQQTAETTRARLWPLDSSNSTSFYGDAFEAWLGCLARQADAAEAGPGATCDPRSLASRLYHAPSIGEARRLLRFAPPDERLDLAQEGLLGQLDERLQTDLLNLHPEEFLANPTAPVDLIWAVRRPNDEATTRLAIRTGRGENERLRSLLPETSSAFRRDLANRYPVELVTALRRADQLRAGDFVDGDLAGIDITRPDTLRAAFGSPPWAHPPDDLLMLLRRHPARDSLAWMLDVHDRGWLSPDEAERLADDVDGEVRLAALRHMPTERIKAPFQALLLTDPERPAELVGLPSTARPRSPAQTTRRCPPGPRPERFHYPPVVARLDGHIFDEAPCWRAFLPVDSDELLANAEKMGNRSECAEIFILLGVFWILILEATGGQTVNVELGRIDGKVRVISILGPGYSSNVPAWMRPALEALLREDPSDRGAPGEPASRRRRTDRRDRRRRIATALRRARR
jgi:hypothetical protein